jgi:hypothetical protein
MPHDDDFEDISMTEEEVEKVERKKAENAVKFPSKTIPVACPDCGCDYIIPLMKAYFTTSFAGNRMTVIWPERQHSDDTALVACPACYIVYCIRHDGAFVKTGRKINEKN